jgi:hypothetical protein
VATNDNEWQQLVRIIDKQPCSGTRKPRDPFLEQIELLAMAYQERPSPVVRFQAGDHESDVLLEFLRRLETNLENQ